MENISKVLNYDFSETVLSDKVIVKFKVKSTKSPHDFLTMFKHKKGERFAIKQPNNKEIIIGIGHEYTWNLDSNDFLSSYENVSILEDFENLKNQITTIEIDEFSENYFGIYGGISDGQNRKSQEWIDFSDTMFIIPNILAVFKNSYIYFTIFFKVKKGVDFYSLWKEQLSFLEKLEEEATIDLQEPKVKILRDIYPEVWQQNIKDSIKEIASNKFSRIALSRKNQLVLERDVSLPAVVKYFSDKKLSFIAFEARKSVFVTSNPLLSLTATEDELSAYLYLQKANLFTGDLSIDFREENIENYYKDLLEDRTGHRFEMYNDKTLVGRNLDVYTAYKTKRQEDKRDLKVLSLLYPNAIIKGYPKQETEKFLLEKEIGSYGFWYAPFGFINSDLDAKFYTCGNMLVGFSNIVTIFTTILVSEHMTYEDIILNSDALVLKNLKLFTNVDKENTNA